MVYQPPKRRPLIFFSKLQLLILTAGSILVAAGVYGVLTLTLGKVSDPEDPTKTDVVAVETEVEEKLPEKKDPLPEFIDLQPVVDDWATTLPKSARAGLKVYDLNNNKTAAELNAEEKFSTASLYKLFLTYEGYREIDAGELSRDETLVRGQTVEKCLDLMIRESDSACAETFLSKIGRDKVEDLLKYTYDLKNSSVKGLTSTASDMILLLKIYYDHQDLSEDSYAAIKDSLLDQPVIRSDLCGGSCNFRIGLPSGFSDNVNVYNKVGWESDGKSKWKIYNDAAILEFKDQNRTYLIAVFTENLPYSNKQIATLADLASKLETAVAKN